MKKLILIIAIIVVAACGNELTRDEVVKQNVEAYLLPNLNDPESYEFVELTLVDSTTYLDNINYRKEYFQTSMKFDQDYVERQQRYKTEIPSAYKEDVLLENIAKVERSERILKTIDSLETALGEKKNDVASYTYYYKIRGNNKMGAKVLNEYILQTGTAPEYKVLKLAENRDQMLVTPNGFPGDELLAKQ